MVGVAGRSRGCGTCRRRKIKCDEGRPICQKCTRSSLACEGYSKFPVFIVRTSEGFVKRKPREEVKTVGAIQSPGSLAVVQGTRSPNSVLSDLNTTPPPLPLLSSQQLLSIAPLLLRRAESLFIEAWLPSSSRCSTKICNWVTELVVKNTRSHALDASMKALTLTRLGRAMNDRFLVQKGGIAYGTALTELQKALWDKKEALEDDTVLAGRICLLHELYESTSNSPTAWCNHETGMTQLMLLRGPERHRTGIGHELFLGARFSSMVRSIQQSKPSELLADVWNDIPWTEKPKDDVQRLYDHGLALGAGLELFRSCMRPDMDQQTRGKLLVKCVHQICEIDTALNLWHFEHCTRIRPFVDTQDCDLELFWNPVTTYESDTSSHFADFNEADVICTYWGIKLLVALSADIVKENIPPHMSSTCQSYDNTPPGSPLLSDVDRSALKRIVTTDWAEQCDLLGKNIMQGVEYLFEPECGLLGPQKAIFPLRIAQLSYARLKRPEVEQCQKLYAQLGTKWGLGYARDLGNTQLSVDTWSRVDVTTPKS